jgi:glycosyltransferase involved in cell wall biosynthesis
MIHALTMLALVPDAFGGRGGIAQYSRDFLSALVEIGAASSILVLPRYAPDPVVPPSGINQATPRASRFSYSVTALCAGLWHRVDVVFCGHLYMAPLAALIARLKRAKLIIQTHGIEAWTRPSRLCQAAVDAADLVLCPSRYTRSRILGWSAVTPERILVLPSTVDERFSPGNGSAVREAWGLQGRRVLLTVGRMDAHERYKGHDRVIAAIPHLVGRGHDVVYVVIGEGDDQPRLAALANESGVGNRVRFMGAVGRQTVIDAYRAADLFLMPSTGEGFGIAFLEAMASGTPALGLAAGGACDALADGELGMAVAEDDLLVAIERALGDARSDPKGLASATRSRFGRKPFAASVRRVMDRLTEAPGIVRREANDATLPGGDTLGSVCREATRKRLVYICDWLPPDFGAVGQYAEADAREWASEGWTVILVGLTSGQSSRRSPEPVGEGSFEVVRVHRRTYQKQKLAARLVWTVFSNLLLVGAAFSALRKADAVLFTGSPPLMLHFIAPLNVLLRKRLIYRVMDFHPECLIAERGRSGLLLGALLRLTYFWRRRVDTFEVLGHDQARRLTDIGIAEDRIHLKRNPSPVTFAPGLAPLALPEELRGGSGIILYSGNFGVAHDENTFIEGYSEYFQQSKLGLRFWLNATGAKADRVEQELQSRGVPIYRTMLVPLEQLARLLLAADVHLITLRDPFVGYVVPSKIHACIESEKRILFVGSQNSDVHLLASRALPPVRYYRVDSGDVHGLVNALRDMERAVVRDRKLDLAGIYSVPSIGRCVPFTTGHGQD